MIANFSFFILFSKFEEFLKPDFFSEFCEYRSTLRASKKPTGRTFGLEETGASGPQP